SNRPENILTERFAPCLVMLRRDKLDLKVLCLDINFHLIVGVIKIAAWVPKGGVGLHASLAVSGAGEDDIVTALRGFPVKRPETPGIFSLVFAKLRDVPTGAAIGGDFDLRDV